MLTESRFTTEIAITVPFHDLDPMSVVGHGHYFRYFEVAREALLNQINYGYRQMRDSGYLWPVFDTRVQYRAALEFEQQIRVRATLEEFEHRLKIAYQIFDAPSGKRTTTGYTVQVAVDACTRELCFACPAIFLEKLEQLEQLEQVALKR